MTTNQSDLPAAPAARDARCPFHPPADYATWQQAEGLQWVRLRDGSSAWAVTRFDDIRSVARNPAISTDATNPRLPKLLGERVDDVPLFFLQMDPPAHTRLRRMITKFFTVKRIDAMRPRIQEVVDGFVEQMISKGPPADLVADFALPVPSLVISVMLGVPYSDHEFFQRNSKTMTNRNLPADEQAQATRTLFAYLLDLVHRKEREPADDIISTLVHEYVATGELTHEQVAINGVALLIAGHDTTARMLSMGTAVLLQHPDQLARLRDTDDPAVVARAVEELLRFLSIAEMLPRVATADITVGEQVIRAGDGVVLNYLAGNHDPSFVADPGVLDLDRNVRGQLAFGYGVHQCLGQPLARAELQIGLPTLLRRLPGLRLAVPFEELDVRHDAGTYLNALPVRW
ncbi:cytochrome P450 [Amycolatopsis suaedae]|uniref:Cytochrome P450 n=1 Tax=Amycolatopsis suaedae TaxID=2510978 RepID=A0A4Q7J3B6_9PSEU|nr:cytochrome P450 [Amycolatopsis suaedae]RZQ61459.1 cytochrome P450 [Amycolatopsis suaedae]